MENGNGIIPVMNMDGNGFGGGSGMWLFALLILFGLFNNGGFGWNNNNYANGFANAIGYENLATQASVDRNFDTQNLLSQTRDIQNAVTNGTAQAVAATNQTFHDTVSILSDKYSELARDIAAVQVGQANALANQNQCCCDIKQLVQGVASDINAGIAQSRYDNALGVANINQGIAANRYENALGNAEIQRTIMAENQKTRDMIATDRMADMQGRINQLELAQATAGMLKFPNSWSFGAGYFPPVYSPGCGCCGNNNI